MLLEQKMIKILNVIREISNDKRIPETIRGEYMDRISDILEGK
jgi:uncharacterized protein (UPF0147 family)